MSSAVVSQVNGFAAVVVGVDEPADRGDESSTDAKLPRWMAWRVMIAKKVSTRLSQLPDVGVKCSMIRGLRSSHLPTLGCLCAA